MRRIKGQKEAIVKKSKANIFFVSIFILSILSIIFLIAYLIYKL